ncbi:MAG: DUF3179 domain-containing protein [Candidatus Thiodiazotropha sp.]|nr:DUF3179 domain-containing protein [Candidatus Thiodiazotropha sp.]MCM8885114.1 DUF3179 domain-containing protein [Candidatus Thiodiazotropha sp.]MCM8921407.1 DUF3179 domain-containing protein [Candidatus Thiodiazotropha sp.]
MSKENSAIAGWRRPAFWLAMFLAQAGAFILFKDLADISQWLIQSSREFTMSVWYNRHILAAVSVGLLVAALIIRGTSRAVCSASLLTLLVFLFAFNYYSGMINPKLMFRAQQFEAKFVPVNEASDYLKESLDKARFSEDGYASVDDIEVLVLETDKGAYAYTDYYLLQPHVVKGGMVDGEEVIMTYCGLTNLGIAYSPVIGDQKLDLTVMTQLKNNLVLFDKNSGEAIQQLWGSMERNPDKGRMKEWPTIRMPFASYRTLYPQGKVFVNEIPAIREHPLLALWDRMVRHGMMHPAVSWQHDSPDTPTFPTIQYKDQRLPMKQMIYALNVGDDYVVYTKEFLSQLEGPLNVEIGNRMVVIDYNTEFNAVTAFFNDTHNPVRQVDVFGRTASGLNLERVNTLKSNLFWFIFAEFYPHTDVNRV